MILRLFARCAFVSQIHLSVIEVFTISCLAILELCSVLYFDVISVHIIRGRKDLFMRPALQETMPRESMKSAWPFSEHTVEERHIGMDRSGGGDGGGGGGGRRHHHHHLRGRHRHFHHLPHGHHHC
ncbi:unnamed protein product [Acanthocheilonema viteae]|uniref:Uncharacterized protein n=1 Tax=Acanthocheilonema viteae TaxID=6277 RepID=A0A498SBV7_ACAVI|nr:unnamed protein product [Acanthocheilonema viteae]